MKMDVSPSLIEKNEVLAFLIYSTSGDYTLQIDEQNPRVSYLVQQGKAIGISYQKEDELLFSHFYSELSQLIQLANNAPEENELTNYIWWAWFHTILWEMQCEGEYEDEEIAKLNEDYIIKLPPNMMEDKSEGQPAPPRNLEDAGIVGFFDQIRSDDRYRVIFENTLGYEIRGIDAILKDNDSGKIIFVELKGTSRKVGSPLSYLKKTKTKGRQLSWEWIFKSLLKVHNAMAASSVFLYCLEPILSKSAERWLVITKSSKKSGIWINQEIKIYDEKVLSKLNNLESAFSLQVYQKEYEELKKSGLHFPNVIG